MGRPHGYISTTKGENHAMAKLTNAEVLRIRSFPGTAYAAAKVFHISYSTAWRIKRKVGWKHLDDHRPIT